MKHLLLIILFIGVCSAHAGEYTGQKDDRVFTGDIWKQDEEILFSGTKQVVRVEPKIIYKTVPVIQEKIVYVEREQEPEIIITTSWCDDTKESCE